MENLSSFTTMILETFSVFLQTYTLTSYFSKK